MRVLLIALLAAISYAQTDGDDVEVKHDCKTGEIVTVGEQQLPCQCLECAKAGGCFGDGACLIDGVCDDNWLKYHGEDGKACIDDGGVPCNMCLQLGEPGDDQDDDPMDDDEEYSVGGPEEERDLTEEELATIYRHVTNALREEGLHEAADSAALEWEEIQAASASDRRRRLSSSSKGGRKSACEGSNKYEKCVEKFDQIVKFMIEHQGNEARELCQKPSNKRQRSVLSCCGQTQVLWDCYDGWTRTGAMGCCGCTQASDSWCYADHGSCPTISGRDVCPPNKWTCSRWGIVPGDLCADSTSTCATEIVSAWLMVADIVANMLMMVFTGGAGNAAKAAATAGKNTLRSASKSVARKSLMTSMKTTLRNAGQSYMWKNLKSNLKDHFKAIPQEIGNYVMEEALAVTSVQEAVSEFSAADLAWDIGELVDPTGVTTFVRYLVEGQEECKYPNGPSDQDMADAIAATNTNFEASCGSTVHGGTQTRRRFQHREASSCSAQTQTRTCRHGSWGGWSGSWSQQSCRTKTRHTRKMDCKQGCPGGWRHYSTSDHGCCKSFWSCGGNKKHCEHYSYGGWQNVAETESAIAQPKKSTEGQMQQMETKSMAQSVISGESSASNFVVMGLAFIGATSMFSFAYKRFATKEYRQIDAEI